MSTPEKRLPIHRDEMFFAVFGSQIIKLAEEKGLATFLSDDEMVVFRACLESGLSCWSEVVELALMAATSERSEP